MNNNSPATNYAFFEFHRGFGRHGTLSGFFISTPEFVKSCEGKVAYFGEVLGKHSNIEIVISEGDFHMMDPSEYSQEEIVKFAEIIGGMESGDRWSTISGYNPIDYITEWEEDGTNDEPASCC